jgi:hypothetical protein
MDRLHVYRADEGRGIAIIPNASHHEAQMRWAREPWAGPEGTYGRRFDLEDWRVEVTPTSTVAGDASRQLTEF